MPLIISVLALVVSVCFAAFSFWQVKTAHETLVTVQRAFVFVKQMDSAVTMEGSNTLRGHNTPVWENSGNTPTKNLLIEGFCLLSKASVDNPFGDPQSTPAAGGDLRLLLGPKLTISGQDCGLRADLIEDVARGGQHFYQWGYATYDDLFRSRHRTEFFVEITNPRLVTSNNLVTFSRENVPCKKHNCADDDCPSQN